MTRSALKYALIAVVTYALGFYAGWGLGKQHDGYVLVPERETAPDRLPYWACAEIVDARLAQADMLGIIAGIVKDGPPDPDKPQVWHFRTAAAKECR